MTKTVAECVTTIQRIARIANETDKSLEALHGITDEFLDLSDKKALALFTETNIAEKLLKAFLNTLDFNTLERLQALMPQQWKQSQNMSSSAS